jgi:CHAD domain-containing protein
MAYRLQAEESVEEGFRRAEGERLDRAIAELTDGVQADPMEAVHTARKELKKERSLLRLFRAALDPGERRARNESLRGAGRRLSATRDADVVIQALEALGDRYAGQLPKQTFESVRSQLETRRAAMRSGLDGDAAFGQVADELREIRLQAEQSRLLREGWSALGPGLRRSYGRGRTAMRRARRDRSVENLHECRKRTKDLWYHLRLLGESSPATKGQAREAHALSDLLGDDHDLAVLRETVGEIAPDLTGDVDAVNALVAHRREQLQQEAMLVGARLYAEKPKAFTRRVRAYWRASRALARAADARHPAEVAERTRTAGSHGVT